MSGLVVDDANHVTRSWGSVNSRVYDALATRTLVITNGMVGSYDTFEGLLPYYNDQESLVDLINEYLQDDKKYDETISLLYDNIVKHHTYDKRADELVNIIQNSVLNNKQVFIKQHLGHKMNYEQQQKMICIGVQVDYGQQHVVDNIKLFIESLELQRKQLELDQQQSFILGLSYHIIVTSQANHNDKNLLQELVESYNQQDDTPQVSLFNEHNLVDTEGNVFLGYDILEQFINFIVEERHQCEWIMIANGDNKYSSVSKMMFATDIICNN